MSAPIDILRELRARGVEQRVEGDRLRFPPVDRVTPDLLARLRERKPELLEFLRTGAGDDPRNGWAARRAAERSGAAGESGGDVDSAPRWIVGPELERLPEPLQGLVMPRPGWTPGSWAAYLRHRAALCDEGCRELATSYALAARMLEARIGGGGR